MDAEAVARAAVRNARVMEDPEAAVWVLARALRYAVTEEREACARLAEGITVPPGCDPLELPARVARVIRLRGRDSAARG